MAKKHSKQAMFAGFADDVRTLLPGKAKQPKKLDHSYHLLSFLWSEKAGEKLCIGKRKQFHLNLCCNVNLL